MLLCINHKIVFEEPRCIRCAACIPACPTGALSAVQRGPTFDIEIHHDACVVCNICVKVCPAGELPERPFTDEDFNQLRHITLAHSKDEKVRFNASSGGIARTLARVALEKGLVDAVYGVRKNANAPFYEGAYFTKPEELAEMANSVYYIFPFAEGLKTKLDGKPIRRLMFIGVNCQIQAAENFYRKYKVELIKVAIFCKQQKTLDYVKWLRRKLKQPADYPASMQFRGEGWPGVLSSGGKRFEGSYTYPFSLDWWRPSGCRFCPNPFGWHSDITLMDPWNLPFPDSKGTTLAVTRTNEGERLWKNAVNDIKEIRCITPEDVKVSVEWDLQKQNKIAPLKYYLGCEPSLKRRLGYAFLEHSREWCGWLALHAPFPTLVEWVIIRGWLRFRKAIFRLLDNQ